MLRGIDVSAYQSRPDFSKLPASDGIKFVFVKCAEGHSNAQDRDFVANRDGARAAGLSVGCYNFVHLEPAHDPAVQAGLHFQASGGLGANPGELPPAMDFEAPDPKDWTAKGCSPSQLRDAALKYLDAAFSLWGCKPILYSYPAFIAALGLTDDFASYPLWLADYRHPGGWPAPGAMPLVTAPWGARWAFWQDSGGQFYKLPNGAAADTNVFNGDAGALAAFCAGTSV